MMSGAASRASWLGTAPRLDVWRELPPPVSGLRAVVVLPVRDEAERLARSLGALADQACSDQRRLGPREFEVLLLANNCSDASARIARQFAARHRRHLRLHVAEVALPRASAHIGFVRSELMNEASRRLAAAGHATPVIASTDADTRVARDWLAANLAEIDAGADVVGGRILVDDETPPTAIALRHRRADAAYALGCRRIAALVDPDPVDPWPNHHQHFGASLAIRAAAFDSVGGVPRVRHLEDDALVRRLEGADFRIRRSPRVRVTTSGRLDGRADVGLAWQLRQWAHDIDSDPLVEPVGALLAGLQVRMDLRQLWQRRQTLAEAAPATLSLAVRLGVGAAALLDALRRAEHFGALWAGIDKGRLDRLRLQGRLQRRSSALSGVRSWLRSHPGRRPGRA